ncbi:MAG TPA: hypothetical protein PLM53_17580 [Spirochaetota bacterium]|nr:hypothetical protein [Spirochaetota bacterium]HPC41308.1 hypothetical protein [Spirochaetota bacterium]HPL17256.1 hypothetical protein [Spirochaetota bacterium]HQF09761.1 hypothetical protein [Spirochaetota bacterium]HQH98910.1 hypothetical protein [Spirochaetota bacterium]
MKKIQIMTVVIAGMILASLAHGQTDYSSAIVGIWKFDMGAGIMATIEYRKDGTFQQVVDELIIGGTYWIKGNKLKTIDRGRTTMYTLVSLADRELTIKRDKDGRTIVYIRQ